MLECPLNFLGAVHGEAVQKVAGNCSQSLLRPRQIPINGAAGNQARELQRGRSDRQKMESFIGIGRSVGAEIV